MDLAAYNSTEEAVFYLLVCAFCLLVTFIGFCGYKLHEYLKQKWKAKL